MPGSTRPADSVRERAIDSSFAKSALPILNAITGRNPVMTFASIRELKKSRYKALPDR